MLIQPTHTPNWPKNKTHLMVCCGSCGQGLGKWQAYVGGCFSVFNTLAILCFPSNIAIMQKGKCKHPRDSSPFSSCHLSIWLDGIHKSRTIRCSKQTRLFPETGIVSLLLDSIGPPLMPEEISESSISGKLMQNLGSWNSTYTRLVMNNALFLNALINAASFLLS